MSSFIGPRAPGDDGGDLSNVVIACTIVCLVVAAAAVAIRFYTRTVVVRALAAEDWFVLAAWFMSIGNSVGLILQAESALGHHIWTVTPEDFINYNKASWIGELFYQLSLACSKISIILLYLRVLTYTYIRRAAYVLLAIVVIYNVLGFFSTVTLCVPLEAYWDPSVSGHCHTGAVYLWLAIGFHIGTDFLIFLLPIPVVFRMMVPLGQKIMLLLIFALGFLVCLISVLRAVWINDLLDSSDFTWDYVAVANWTSVEVNAAIVCACLLVIKPLITKLWRKAHPKSERPRRESSGRPATIGTEALRYNSKSPGLFTREKNSSGSEKALVDDPEVTPMQDIEAQYAAAVREVAGPAKAY